MLRALGITRFTAPSWLRQHAQLPNAAATGNEKEFKAGDTAWIDGIRGIASCLVVTSHIIMSLHDHMVYPASADVMWTGPSHWPFLHAPAEGFPWLATFFVLSGWVNALKPLALVDAGDSDRALAGLSSGCLRRSARLMLPPGIATVMSWVLAQLGAYSVANAKGSAWMRNTAPSASASWSAAVSNLVRSIYTTWTDGTNYYDGNQWCMLNFLRGSMTLYLVLMATVKATPRMRRVIMTLMFLWSWRAHDEFVAIPTYAGILLADFSTQPSTLRFASSSSPLKRLASTALFVAGFYLISVPNVQMAWSPFYYFITKPGAWFGYYLYPPGGTVYHLTNYMGLFTLFVGIVLSHPLQRFFAHPLFVRLGQLSLPIYLLHGSILRSLGATLLYAGASPAGAPVSMIREIFALAVFAATTLVLAIKWEERVEPWCARVTAALDGLVTGQHGGARRRGGRFVDIPVQQQSPASPSKHQRQPSITSVA